MEQPSVLLLPLKYRHLPVYTRTGKGVSAFEGVQLHEI